MNLKCLSEWKDGAKELVVDRMSFDNILKTHANFVNSVCLKMSEEDKKLPYLYWTPKLHKTPSKHHFIAGSPKYTTKDLPCSVTKLLSIVNPI